MKINLLPLKTKISSTRANHTKEMAVYVVKKIVSGHDGAENYSYEGCTII